MTTIFLLPKDPTVEETGDTAMMRLVIDSLKRLDDTQIICLSGAVEDPPVPHVTRVAKPLVRPQNLVRRSLARRMSLLHARFDVDQVVAAIDRTQADTYVAMHYYMAEPWLRSTKRTSSRLLVVDVVPEALVWRENHGLIGRLEARRINRDEARVRSAAAALAGYDSEISKHGGTWLPVSLPPGQPVDVASTPPRLVFLGDRTWGPNFRAYERIVELWPQISDGIDGAELTIVGRPGKRSLIMPGLVDMGFVDDLGAVLSGCRAMVAPVEVGGGVRVKLLEAASRGLPVVATRAAVGSLTQLLSIEPATSDEHFVAACRQLLRDAALAAGEGRRLFDANRAAWESGVAFAAVREWWTA